MKNWQLVEDAQRGTSVNCIRESDADELMGEYLGRTRLGSALNADGIQIKAWARVALRRYTRASIITLMTIEARGDDWEIIAAERVPLGNLNRPRVACQNLPAPIAQKIISNAVHME